MKIDVVLRIMQQQRQAAAAFLRDAADHLETIKTPQLTPSDHQADLFYRLWRGIDLGMPYSWVAGIQIAAEPVPPDPRVQDLIAAVPNDHVPNGKRRRDNARTSIPLLMAACAALRVTKAPHIAYIMGTVSHECYFAPITEIGSRQYFERYQGRTDLGNIQPGDGFKFRGRGFVQITGRRNYQIFSTLLGINLIGDPDLALDPAIAAQICVRGMRDGLFTSRNLSNYDRADGGFDFVGARAIVNGKDQDKLIASYAEHYLRTLT